MRKKTYIYRRQNQVSTKSPTFNSTSNQSPGIILNQSTQKKDLHLEISDHTPIISNQYKISQDQSLARVSLKKIADQEMLLSKFGYKNLIVPLGNMSTNFSKIEIPMQQQYRTLNNIKNHTRSKSC